MAAAVVLCLAAMPGSLAGAAAAPHTRAVIRGAGPSRRSLEPRDAKVDAQLRRLIAPEPSAAAPASNLVPVAGAWKQGDALHVHVHLEPGAAPVDLTARGLLVERTVGDVVEGWVGAQDVAAVADLPAVRAIRPARPGRLRVTADAASRAALARATGYDGSGITIGVISDGAGSLRASSVPSGCDPGSGSEGQALMQVAHTLAPGATLLFSSGITSSLGFIDSISCLRAAGARVIVDDLGFYDQPFFEDGPVAQAVRAAVQAGVSFHSAAGNDADQHYSAPFRATPGSSYHDFATSGAADNYDEIDVAAGGALDCMLQWNDPFGGAADDYDLEVYDLATSPVALITSSTNLQNGTQDPYEDFSVTNVGRTTGRAGIAIKKVSGANRILKLFCFGGDTTQYLTPSGSIIGHAAVPEVVAVGAMDVRDSGLDTVEPFSSQGPVTIDFPTPETRAKPDLVAFDGVTTTVAGFRSFYGTSAAAPDSAAVAALLLSKKPCLTPAQIQQALTSSAVDIGSAGLDPVTGAGRLDALAAIESVSLDRCTADTQCDDGVACTTDTCTGCTCVHRPACDDGNPCTADTCDPVTGCQHAVVADGTSCADADVCNGTETCHGGTCTSGSALVCAAADACTVATCDATRGCTVTTIEGFGGVSCVCGQGLSTAACSGAGPPGAVRNRFRRACHLMTRAARASDTRRERALVNHALTVFLRAERTATAAVQRGAVTATCGDALTAVIDDARSRAGRLGTTR